MIPNAKRISEIIRAKKKALLNKEPELVDTDSHPDLNPNELSDLRTDAQIQSSLDSPEKIDGRVKELEVDDEMGPSDEELSRMKRLRKYIDDMDYED